VLIGQVVKHTLFNLAKYCN